MNKYVKFFSSRYDVRWVWTHRGGHHLRHSGENGAGFSLSGVFNQIEHWSMAKSLLCYFVLLYAAYVGCYLLNDWIPFKSQIIGIFTAVFVVCYFVIWLTVYLIVKGTEKRLNEKLNRVS